MEAGTGSDAPSALQHEATDTKSVPSDAVHQFHDDDKGKKPAPGARPRSIKTPLQREALEAAFLINQFPAEEARRALGDRIQLTENQVQVWFSHKRRKDKKTQAAGTQPQGAPLPMAAGTSEAAPAPAAATPAVPAAISAPQPSDQMPANTAPPVSAITHIPLASLPSFNTLSNRPALPQAHHTDAFQSSAPHTQLQQAAQAQTSAPMSVSVALNRVRPQASAPLQQPQHSFMNGHVSAVSQPVASLANFEQPATVADMPAMPASYAQAAPMQAHVREHQAPYLQAAQQNSFPSRAIPAVYNQLGQPVPPAAPSHESHIQQQALPHLEAALANTLSSRMSPAVPSEQPYAHAPYARASSGTASVPHSALNAQQNTLAAESSPAAHRLTMPLSAGTFAVGASPAWLHQQQQQQQRNALRMSHASATTPAMESTPAARSQLDSMHSDMDADTDDNDVATEGLRSDLRQLIELAKQSLPVPYRPDGPQLAVEFDPPPSPDTEAADPDAPAKRKRVFVDGYEMEEDGEDGMNFKKARVMPGQFKRPPSANRGREDAERKVHKEMARADLLAKRVEQTMQKDKERMEREKKRVQEKMEREKKKDEVAQQKAAEKLRQFHEREAKKAAERAEKEKRAEERKRLQDEKRREREMLRALAAQERQATRQRSRETAGPKDDEDIEWEQLMEAHHQAGYGSGTEDHPDQDNNPLPLRPEFPSPSLHLVPAFASGLDAKLGADMLMIWTFLHSFGDLLGLPAASLDELLAAVMNGEQSKLLGDIHIALLKLLQADMEEAYATGAIQSGGATNFMDRAIINCAHYLEEALAWGFDIDVWRAHLNAQTWPEVMRQYGIAAGLGGQKRPKPKKEGTKPKLGTEGEDIITDDAGRVTLVAPARFGLGTVKGAAYKVLQEVGSEGLTITEIAKRIQKSGLRDLRTSKTPEASVAGALSRDVIFVRVAPATYALKAKLAQQRPASAAASDVKAEVKSEDVKMEDVKAEDATSGEIKLENDQSQVKQELAASEAAVKPDPEQQQHHDEDLSDSDDSEDEDEFEAKAEAGETWLQLLKTHEYDHLTFEQRMAALKTLVHMAIDGPAVRATLEARIEDSQRIRKQMFEEAKAEKRRRQQEAADKAKKSAEEAQRALEAYNANPDGGPMQLDNAAPGADPSGHHSDGNRQDAPSTAQELEDEASAAAAAKLRQQQRADLLRRAEEGHAVRGEPLGLDRRHNRYWHLAADPSIPGDASTGRILVESYVDGTWRLLYKADQLEELMASLERKGAREGPLYNALVRYQPKVEAGMPSHPIQIPPALDQQSQHQHFQLNKEHHRTLWSIPVQAAAHIQGRDPGISLSTCMTAAVKLSKLKADMLRVEAALPSEALRDTTWSRAAWQSTVHNAQEVAPLQHALAELEMAIHPVSMWTNHHPRHLTAIKRDWLPIGQDIHGRLPTPAPQLQLPSGHAQGASVVASLSAEHLGCLPTLAAVSLRLHAIDAAIMYQPGEQSARETLPAYKYIQRPTLLVAPGGQADLDDTRQPLQAASGATNSQKGQTKQTLFPPFPQALLQGPRQTFKLPVADFKQAELDAQNGINYPGKTNTGLKIRLPIGKVGLAVASRKKPRPAAPRNKSAGSARSAASLSKPFSKKELLHRQLSEGDMDLDDVAGRSTTATPGPSDDDMPSPGRSGNAFDDEPDISSDDDRGNNASDVELSD